MEPKIGVILLIQAISFTVAVDPVMKKDSADRLIAAKTEYSLLPEIVNSTDVSGKVNTTSTKEVEPSVDLSGAGTISGNFTLDLLNQPVQGDGTNRTVPRKGIKASVKPRKGAEATPVIKSKPLASETDSTEDEVSVQPDYTALIISLSLGIVLVLILASVTYWRLRDVWERRQYKRVDFLIDGLYTDT